MLFFFLAGAIAAFFKTPWWLILVAGLCGAGLGLFQLVGINDWRFRAGLGPLDALPYSASAFVTQAIIFGVAWGAVRAVLALISRWRRRKLSAPDVVHARTRTLYHFLPSDRDTSALLEWLATRRDAELADFWTGMRTALRGYDLEGIDSRAMMIDQIYSLSLMPEPAAEQLKSLSLQETRRLLLGMERL